MRTLLKRNQQSDSCIVRTYAYKVQSVGRSCLYFTLEALFVLSVKHNEQTFVSEANKFQNYKLRLYKNSLVSFSNLRFYSSCSIWDFLNSIQQTTSISCYEFLLWLICNNITAELLTVCFWTAAAQVLTHKLASCQQELVISFANRNFEESKAFEDELIFWLFQRLILLVI